MFLLPWKIVCEVSINQCGKSTPHDLFPPRLHVMAESRALDSSHVNDRWRYVSSMGNSIWYHTYACNMFCKKVLTILGAANVAPSWIIDCGGCNRFIIGNRVPPLNWGDRSLKREMLEKWTPILSNFSQSSGHLLSIWPVKQWIVLCMHHDWFDEKKSCHHVWPEICRPKPDLHFSEYIVPNFHYSAVGLYLWSQHGGFL